MSTKKIVIIIVSIVLAVGLVIAIFVGAIVGITLYSIGRSEAAETAKTYLRTNEVLKQDIGEIKDFGSFVTGNVSINNNDGNATINIKVIGERKTVNATVDLIYRSGRPWRVVSASYRNEEGKTIDLLNPYDARNPVYKLAA
jgi:hypothetical protein